MITKELPQETDWGIQTDNLPAYQQPQQVRAPSPRRAERYLPPTGATTTTTETGQQISTETGQQIITPVVPEGPAPTMGEMPEFQIPEGITLPEMGAMPEFAIPEYGEVPQFQVPEAPEYPEFEAPERPSEKKYVQEAAAPAIRALRRQTREVLNSGNFSNNPIVQATIKEQVLRGHGDALSQIMGMARREGGEKAERIYRDKFDTVRINYQTEVSGVRDDYQTKVMKAQTDWQGKMQALTYKWEAGLVKSRAEYQAAINDRQIKWTAEVDTIKNEYNTAFAAAQMEYSTGVQKVLAEFETEWQAYLAKFGKKVDITGKTITDITGTTTQEMQYQYGTPGGIVPGEYPMSDAQLALQQAREFTLTGHKGATKPERPGYYPPFKIEK